MSPLSKTVLSALAVAGTTYAASCSTSATATIENPQQATQLSSCSTFSGSIAIATSVVDSIALDGIRKIDGDLTISNNSKIQSFSGSDLEVITGAFTLDEVQVLSTVNFPKLTTVNSIKWNALPNLQALQMTAQISKASVIDIENTQLQSLKGLNLESVDELTVANNPYINTIDMQLGNVTRQLTLTANNPEVNVSFPNMEWAFNLTFRNCSSVLLPSLTTLNSSLGLYGNTFESFNAPNLTKIGGALSLVSNTQLTNVSFPQLTVVSQNLQIANNTKLSEINGFPKLATIGGALDFNGNMSSVELPSLHDVKGAFNIQSTGQIQDTCDKTFQPLKAKGNIHGSFTCKGEVANPGGQGTTPIVTGGHSKPSSAASAINLESNMIGLAGLAAAFFL